MADFSIKRNDLLPVLEAILKDANDNPVDLTDATDVVFHMREEDGETLKIDGVAGTFGANRATGKVIYAWRWLDPDFDTDTSGLFLAEFEVTWTGGKIQTFPSRGYISIQIVDDLS